MCCRLWESMGLELQPDLCSLLIKDVIYHEEAVRQAGAEALSRAVAQYRKQAAEVMSKLTEIYQEKLYVSTLALGGWQAWAAAFSVSHFSFCLSWRCALNLLLSCLSLAQTSVSWTSNGTIGQVGGMLWIIQKGCGRAVSLEIILTPDLLSACFFTLLFC